MSADYFGLVATAETNGGIANMQSPGKVGGVEHVILDSYTGVAVASGATIQIGSTLPAGAIITDIIVESEAQGNSQTLAIGDANTADLYCAATSVNAAAVLRLTKNLGYVVGTASGDNKILLTVAGNALSASADIRAAIKYVFNA